MEVIFSDIGNQAKRFRKIEAANVAMKWHCTVNYCSPRGEANYNVQAYLLNCVMSVTGKG